MKKYTNIFLVFGFFLWRRIEYRCIEIEQDYRLKREIEYKLKRRLEYKLKEKPTS